MPKKTLLLPALTAAAALFGATSAASAATVSYDGGTLVYRAAPGEQNRTGPYPDAWKEGMIRIPSGYGVTITEFPAQCEDERENGGFVNCPKPAALRFELGDGDDDYASSSDMPADVPVTVDGGPGTDDLRGRDADDTLLGGPGNDKLSAWTGNDVLDGGEGDDELNGWIGNDRLAGGGGNDMLQPDDLNTQSTDVVDGGAGIDTIESDYWPGEVGGVRLPVAITLGGGADDGRPGENDDVQGVERLTLTGPGKVVGTDGPEFVKFFQIAESGEIAGNGGDDELRASDGADRIDGGTGNDVIDAGFGDDTIVGGPGSDRISADQSTSECSYLWCKHPFGNDVVDARDGEADSIDCGAGTDSVKADPADTVAPNCETVDRAAVAAPANSAGKGAKAARRVTALSSLKLRRALRSGLTLRIRGLRKGAKVKVLAGRRVVARGTARKAGTVKVRFTRSARRALGRKRSVKLTIVATGVRETLTLKR